MFLKILGGTALLKASIFTHISGPININGEAMKLRKYTHFQDQVPLKLGSKKHLSTTFRETNSLIMFNEPKASDKNDS